MVVDVDDRRVGGDLLDAASRPLEIARVEEENQLRIFPDGRLLFDLIESGKKRVHLRQRRRDEHPHVLAGRAQRLSERQAAAKRVAVGVFVPEDQDLLVVLYELLDLVVLVARPALGSRYGFSS